MYIPVTKNFKHTDVSDVVGKFNTDTGELIFQKPQNMIKYVLALGYRLEQPDNHEAVSRITIKEISLVEK